MRADIDRDFMERALDLAARARGRTSPNPLVGAVVVRGHKVVGEGYHHRAGSSHAEVLALREAGTKARGATLYCTLEPCCHQGRTGPCTEAIMGAGIARVVYCVSDPNPLVAGKGGRRLRQAGIEVSTGVHRKKAERLNEAYIKFHRHGIPFTTLKIAQTLDGRIATTTGDSKWISGKPARRLAHTLRSEHDAVLVGSGTVRVDDPALTVRHVRGRNPYRVVVTKSCDLPDECSLLRKNGDHKTILATTERAARRHARSSQHQLTYWITHPDGRRHLQLQDVLRQAAAFGLQSILIEGGAQIATSFLKEGLVDKLVLFMAPKIIGGGLDAIGDLGLTRMKDALELRDVTTRTIGRDSVLTGYIKGSV